MLSQVSVVIYPLLRGVAISGVGRPEILVRPFGLLYFAPSAFLSLFTVLCSFPSSCLCFIQFLLFQYTQVGTTLKHEFQYTQAGTTLEHEFQYA